MLGGSSARDPLEGEGVERIAEAVRALGTPDVEQIGDDVLIQRPTAGVVMFTGLVADLGTVEAVERPPTASA